MTPVNKTKQNIKQYRLSNPNPIKTGYNLMRFGRAIRSYLTFGARRVAHISKNLVITR